MKEKQDWTLRFRLYEWVTEHAVVFVRMYE